jgi:pSer/pThr/pTyr-binding forkhead associated (FHA) protein
VSVQLQVFGPGAPSSVVLEGERFTVGKAPGNDLVLDDPSTSRMHLVLERAGPTWVATDAGSTNGTWINGRRLLASRALHHGDRLVVGVVALVVVVGQPRSDTVTDVLAPPPQITPRERELLIALCRPVLDGHVLTEPASVREIAAELSVTESAVKKALGRLYSKFDLHDDDRRRGRLAIAAIRAGLAPHPTSEADRA